MFVGADITAGNTATATVTGVASCPSLTDTVNVSESVPEVRPAANRAADVGVYVYCPGAVVVSDPLAGAPVTV